MTPQVTGKLGIPICIFAKPPVPAEVKTRLIPALGETGAAELAAAMLRDTWEVAASLPGGRPILATTRRGNFPIAVADCDLWLQGDGDLGRRLEQILTRGLEQAGSAIALGADSPGLTGIHLKAALEGLENHDAVLGPSLDGGFYLLGLRRCPPGLLASLPWSRPDTCQAVVTRLRQHGFSILELELLFDVDVPGDLRTLGSHLAAAGEPSATRAWWLENVCASALLFPL